LKYSAKPFITFERFAAASKAVCAPLRPKREGLKAASVEARLLSRLVWSIDCPNSSGPGDAGDVHAASSLVAEAPAKNGRLASNASKAVPVAMAVKEE